MILLVEPISKNTGMFVPAYPLPLLEIGSYVKHHLPGVDIRIVSFPMDYGLPLTKKGRHTVYEAFFKDLSKMKPRAVGISCTGIPQADETIKLCTGIKRFDPEIFTFVGGYLPTIYHNEILSMTSDIDLVVIGEGEEPALEIIDHLKSGKRPLFENISNTAWKKDGVIHSSQDIKRFDLKKKVPLNLDLLINPHSFSILPYAFSRGCPYQCNFCMEEFIRPRRQVVPEKIIAEDLLNLSHKCSARVIGVSDALFKSFDLFSLIESLGMKVIFETRCDVLNPLLIPQIREICELLVLGFESASFETLRRMNKIKDRYHYESYIANTAAIFRLAVENEVPIMIFMIAGYPGDTRKDLEESLAFVKDISVQSGAGGCLFKIGECHAYPKTKTYRLAKQRPDVVFDDDGFFGQNIVTQSSCNLTFDTITTFAAKIFNLSNITEKFEKNIRNLMPFFRLPVQALADPVVPDTVFKDRDREILNVNGDSLSIFRDTAPRLTEKYKELMSGSRSTRTLNI